jgi:alcohol dehydrogenase class IV
VPIPQPVLLVGPGSAARLGQAIARFGHRRLLLVTDAEITRLALARPLTDALTAGGVDFVVFDAVLPDAPIALVEEGLALFRAEACDGIVAFGGGSVMDTAKVIGLAAANHKPVAELAGYFRGLHGPAPIYAVPTTAGTGSEVTVAALMTGLPPAITAATGMDALTHAVEAFVSGWATPGTDRMALAAASLIWQYLPVAFEHGHDLQAREQMALASTYAGLAFTRANVGNVHAVAHQLGARYHVPHGLANAILLPPVLRFTLPEAAPQLARLARHLGLASDEVENDATLAERFVDGVQALNDRLGIPRSLAPLIEPDIAALAEAACHEADHNYPVPRRMAQADAESLLREVLPPAAPPAATPRRKAAPAARPARPRKPAASSRRAPLRRPVRRARRPHRDE